MFNQNRMKKQESKKVKRGLGTSGTSPNMPTSRIIGMPGGEGEEKELKNLVEKLMKENVPNLLKELDIQVQEAQNPKQAPNKDTKRTTSIHIIIKVPKEKAKKRILKTAREKQRVTYKGVPIRLAADLKKKKKKSASNKYSK